MQKQELEAKRRYMLQQLARGIAGPKKYMKKAVQEIREIEDALGIERTV